MNAQTKVRAGDPLRGRATRAPHRAPSGLGHAADIAIADYALYLREREYSAKLEKLLSRAVCLLDMETHRRELAGEDVAHLRAFISEARSV